MTELGELSRVDVRAVWPNEAHDFTPWLAENIGRVGEAVGLELELEDREADVGSFALDLLARDLGTDELVIIENQFGSTDHDHLGKLLTYAAGFDAGSVVWVCEKLREEHRQALDWLNQRTDSSTHFFAVIVELLQIDDSRPAFNFRPVVIPNEWQKLQRRQRDRSVSERGERYRDYFQHLIDVLRDQHEFTNARLGQPQNWYSFSSGMSGISYGASFAQGGRARAELYIGTQDPDENQRLFHWLKEGREGIEAALGSELQWEELEDKIACRIALYRSGSIDDGAEELKELHDWHVQWLLKLKRVFGPRLDRFRTEERGQ